jgi:hypothetical protein
MKKTILLFFCMLHQFSNAQFSNDPANPLAVCNAVNAQQNVIALNDNSKGYYVFWRDNRSNISNGEIYGQHLDSAGHSLWAANGKRIVQSFSTNVSGFRCTGMQNGTLVTWIQNQDSMFCKLINNNGNDVWSQPVLVAKNGSGILSVSSSGYNVFQNDSGVTITYSYVYTGGTALFGFNRVSFAGTLRWPVNNFVLNIPGYDYRSVSDGQNGFYSLSKGNGLGSGMHVQHYDMQGTALWPAHVDITGGVSANGYGGNINLHYDADGNFYAVWDASSGQIQGNYAWSPERRPLSSIVQTQGRSHSLLRNNNIYVAWNDSRIANQTSLYMQRVDTSGVDAWTTDGIFAGIINGYYAYPKIAYSDSNSVVCFYLGSGSINLEAQRVRDDSTLTFAVNGVILSSGNPWINYSDYTVMSDAAGCNAVFWTTMTDDIRGAKLCSDGTVVPLIENELQNGFTVYPVPAQQFFTIEFNSERPIEEIAFYSIEGKIVKKIAFPDKRQITVDCSDVEPGIYLITAQFNGQLYVQKLIVNR